MMPLIQLSHVVKTFGTKCAVNDISLDVSRGEILAFIGPNGAGKSTTMRMITGYLPPDSGKISICGCDIENQPVEAKKHIGYLPESAPLYPNRTVTEFLTLLAGIRGFRGKAKKEAVENVIQKCALQTVRHQLTDTLSKGYKHRTCLAQALLHNPEILILDEPTDGLDPNQKRDIRELIKTMGREKAIIVSTHILEEVEALSTRVVLIDRGGIVFDGTQEALCAKFPSYTGPGRLDRIFYALTNPEVQS